MKKNDEPKIERGIPVPAYRGRGYTTILRKMKVGESVFLTTPPSNISNLAAQAFGKPGCVTARRMDGGIRVWRIK